VSAPFLARLRRQSYGRIISGMPLEGQGRVYRGAAGKPKGRTGIASLPQRHVPNSIATLHRRLVVAFARALLPAMPTLRLQILAKYARRIL
jgi:hypothetical protein